MDSFMELRVKNRLDEQTEALINSVIGVAIDVHRELGSGYFEKVYEQVMSIELKSRGFVCSTQVPIAVYYKGVKIRGQILDLVVEKRLVLEIKSVDTILPIHEAQILSYLKSTGLVAGLLINFKERLVKDGIKRFVRTSHH
ncbi:GxxExxY protein [Simkania negevensis]|uniref:GxxExxY protein n=1 Tax=Simkania negevensis TaxID=83561 RepID=A0ABS3ARY6_9BACT|nr:GxxExxY protein [Simkania negevensis]